MIPRWGLCVGEDGKPERVTRWPLSVGSTRILAPFVLSPMENGPMGLAMVQGRFFAICQYFHHGRWITVEQWVHTVRQEQIERQKTNPWTYRKGKWDGVKVVVLPRTEPDGLVMDSNTAIIMERETDPRKQKEIAGTPAVPGAAVHRGERPIDCDYAALAHFIGHDAARECFKKHNRQISS